MAQYRMLLEYDGTEYHGWQLQPDARTLQGVLEAALATALRHPVRVAASGRTDAGVHAMGQVATFRTEHTLDARELRKSVNALTPPDIAVRDIAVVGDGFDARRHATARCTSTDLDAGLALRLLASLRLARAARARPHGHAFRRRRACR
jgi:tRNA pseudouridine38-40 synthase